MMKFSSLRLVALSCALTLAAGFQSDAGDSKEALAGPAAIEEPTLFTSCDISDYATWYSNKDNPVIQKFAFTGRLQADASYFDGGHGDRYQDAIWRRFRAGFKTQLFGDFTVHSEVDLDLNSPDPLYNKLTDAYIAWSPADAFELRLGKHGAPFTLDGATSSKKLIRLERGLLASNFWFTDEYFTGVSANGEVGNWIYRLGAFSGDIDSNSEFGKFNAGYFGLASLGYNFAAVTGLDKSLVRVDYLYNEEDENNGTADLEQIVSLNSQLEKAAFGVWTDLAAARGYSDQSDLFAVEVMPFVNLSAQWQLVTSYHYVTSSGDNGVKLDRYENRIETGRSDAAHDFYVGVNYYLCGHKLKWQTGVEYTTASDHADDGGGYDGWGVTSGIRISW